MNNNCPPTALAAQSIRRLAWRHHANDPRMFRVLGEVADLVERHITPPCPGCTNFACARHGCQGRKMGMEQ